MSTNKNSRFDDLSDDAVIARWKAGIPFYARMTALGAVAAVGLWLLNHFAAPPQKIVDALQLAFYIAVLFVAMFGLLLITGLVYVRSKHKDQS